MINKYNMINVGNKRVTYRKAIATGKIFVGEKIFNLIENKKIPKGDPLILAEIAGINATKKTSDVIILCHQLLLDHVIIKTELKKTEYSITIFCIVSAYAKTGVEMEALVGVQAALLTIYDLTKMFSHELKITDISLIFKKGGKSGTWINPNYNINNDLLTNVTEEYIKNITVSILTISDRASNGIYIDKSGPLLKQELLNIGANVLYNSIIPDNKEIIISRLKSIVLKLNPQLIITTGGTGLASLDVTPEAIEHLCPRIINGIGEMLRNYGDQYTNYSWLSRSIAGVYKKTLIISLPGNPKAIKESIDILKDILYHAIKIISKENI